MRKIEEQMLRAISKGINWQSGNTSTRMIDDVNIAVYLFGNEIAIINTETGFTMPNVYTFKKWPTRTTKSRLKALGIDYKAL